MFRPRVTSGVILFVPLSLEYAVSFSYGQRLEDDALHNKASSHLVLFPPFKTVSHLFPAFYDDFYSITPAALFLECRCHRQSTLDVKFWSINFTTRLAASLWLFKTDMIQTRSQLSRYCAFNGNAINLPEGSSYLFASISVAASRVVFLSSAPLQISR